MSPHTNFHAPGTSLSWRIQIGHKSGLFIIYYYLSVSIKPPRHRFGFSLAGVGNKTLYAKIHMKNVHVYRLNKQTNIAQCCIFLFFILNIFWSSKRLTLSLFVKHFFWNELGYYFYKLKINRKCPKNLHHGNLMVEDAGKSCWRHEMERDPEHVYLSALSAVLYKDTQFVNESKYLVRKTIR